MNALGFFVAATSLLGCATAATSQEVAVSGPDARLVPGRREVVRFEAGGAGEHAFEFETKSDGVVFAYAVAKGEGQDALDPALRLERVGGEVAAQDANSGGGTTPYVRFNSAAGERWRVVLFAENEAPRGAAELVLGETHETPTTRAAARRARERLAEAREALKSQRLHVALSLLEENRRELTSVPGHMQSGDVTKLKSFTGLLASQIGQPELALPLLEDIVEVYETCLPPDHRSRVKGVALHAEALLLAGQASAARERFEGVLDAFERTLPASDRRLARTLHELALAYGAEGKIERELEVRAELLERCERGTLDVTEAELAQVRLGLEFAAQRAGAESRRGSSASLAALRELESSSLPVQLRAAASALLLEASDQVAVDGARSPHADELVRTVLTWSRRERAAPRPLPPSALERWVLERALACASRAEDVLLLAETRDVLERPAPHAWPSPSDAPPPFDPRRLALFPLLLPNGTARGLGLVLGPGESKRLFEPDRQAELEAALRAVPWPHLFLAHRIETPHGWQDLVGPAATLGPLTSRPRNASATAHGLRLIGGSRVSDERERAFVQLIEATRAHVNDFGIERVQGVSPTDTSGWLARLGNARALVLDLPLWRADPSLPREPAEVIAFGSHPVDADLFTRESAPPASATGRVTRGAQVGLDIGLGNIVEARALAQLFLDGCEWVILTQAADRELSAADRHALIEAFLAAGVGHVILPWVETLPATPLPRSAVLAFMDTFLEELRGSTPIPEAVHRAARPGQGPWRTYCAFRR